MPKLLSQQASLEERLATRAKDLRDKAKLANPTRREKLMREAEEIERSIQLNHWISSPGLRMPE